MTAEELLKELRWVIAANPQAKVKVPMISVNDGHTVWLDVVEVEYGEEVRLLI